MGLAMLAGCRTEVGIVDPNAPDPTVPSPRIDRDRDGFTLDEGDCDDTDERVSPGAREECDGLDNDCDATVDGAGACAVRDRFDQTLAVDVLMVVDTTPEMGPYLSRLASGSWELGRNLVGEGFDSRLAVLTMDASEPSFVAPEGLPAFLRGQGAAADEARWEAWVSAALDARTTEAKARARDAVLAAFQLEAPEHAASQSSTVAADTRAADTGQGEPPPPFRRPEVPLVVLFLSRQDDASAVPPSAFVGVLAEASLAGPPVFHAIVPDAAGCAEDPGAVADIEYHALADITGGVTADACASDYRPFLSVVGQLAADEGLGRRFPLTQAADVARPVGVSVTLPEGYGYDLVPGDFEILESGRVLWLRSPPVAGSEIVIDYERDPSL